MATKYKYEEGISFINIKVFVQYMQTNSNDHMIKIHPESPAIPVNSVAGEDKSFPYLTTEQESFTIWMRSLVFHGKGCTVFNSKGNLTYRVDNYNSKNRSEVYLMDSDGKVLFTLHQKNSGLSKSCEGYNSTGARFRVRKTFKISSRELSSSYKVIIGSLRDSEQLCYNIVNHGSNFAVEDGSGRLLAEVKKKETNIDGLDLGNDVLTMNVEPQVDHSFIMGIVIAYSLIKCKL